MCGVQNAPLTSRTQRVKLTDTTSDSTEVAGGALQCTLSGTNDFLHTIDDLHTDSNSIRGIDENQFKMAAILKSKTVVSGNDIVRLHFKIIITMYVREFPRNLFCMYVRP